ncbi:hypothetical protein [Tsukamurella spumae]|uniref:AttH domain-containing protein n=1 Tax=Tsukamurella spumae TaxID=44753 RepID=A0A846WYW4_9ACTN|nr:hypothetical protein [Tsukamurella spumae]NKY16960.1 hypothetical protein [Tsukamurella spumae]
MTAQWAGSPLSPADDLPIHQVAEVIRHPATSDRNFYDRYYFNAHSGTASAPFLVLGLGVYPNLGVVDCFAVARYRDDQIVFRASRALGADRTDTVVGPMRLEVLDGLQRLRVALDPGADYDLAFDLTFTATGPAHLEPRHFHRQLERVTFDTQRFVQVGSWAGELTVDGERFDASDWRGNRDRSWGVRPVGEAEPPGRRVTEAGNFFWIYSVLRLPEATICVVLQEDVRGRPVVEDATWIPHDGSEPRWLGHVAHDIEFVSGTRQARAARLAFTGTDGARTEVDIAILTANHFGFGTGYGLDADWRHGMWQGEEKVEGRRFRVPDLDVNLTMLVPVEYLATCTVRHPDGRTEEGEGLFEFGAIGPHTRYGFQHYVDPAP